MTLNEAIKEVLKDKELDYRKFIDNLKSLCGSLSTFAPFVVDRGINISITDNLHIKLKRKMCRISDKRHFFYRKMTVVDAIIVKDTLNIANKDCEEAYAILKSINDKKREEKEQALQDEIDNFRKFAAGHNINLVGFKVLLDRYNTLSPKAKSLIVL
jgi:hypothetical protein